MQTTHSALVETAFKQTYLNRGSLTEALRVATMPQHQKIELNKRMSRLMQDDYQRHEYLDILIRYYGFYRTFESWLTRRQPSMLQDYRYWSRSAALQQDIYQLDTAVDIDDVAFLTMDPNTKFDYWFVFGCLYVIEGSSLGAKMIRKKLIASLGSGIENAISFFSEPRSLDRLSWKSFKNKVDNDYLLSGDIMDMESAVAGANFTFGLLDDWLSKEERID